MAISKRSLQQAKQVLKQILEENKDLINTRANLDRKIELVKFPHLKEAYKKHLKNTTLYVSRQYNPIRYWLIDNKFLTSNKNRFGNYIYTVNKEAISKYLQLKDQEDQSFKINKTVMSKTQTTTNLFQSVKSFINSKKPNEKFTTRELTNAMQGIESVTRWKSSNGNNFYRTHTYRTYLKRLGFIEIIKRGEWKVIANIPDWLDSGHINFVLFNQCPFRDGKYKGETKDQIKEKIKLAIESSSIEIGYQLGDTVKIIGNIYRSINSIGDIGVITQLDMSDDSVRILVNDELNFANWSKIYDIELVKRADEPAAKTNKVEITETKVIEENPIQNQDTPIYIVAIDRGTEQRFGEDFMIFKDLESAKAKYIDLLTLKIVTKVYETEFGYTRRIEVTDILNQQDIKKLASEIIGDGGDNNLWFVTESSHVLVNTNGDCDYETLDGYEDGNATTYGPFLTYKSACAAYDDIDLDAFCGIGQVTIEDREIGTVKEKFLRKQVVTKFVEDEHDDSSFYGK